jgi:hypothetical protein
VPEACVESVVKMHRASLFACKPAAFITSRGGVHATPPVEAS